MIKIGALLNTETTVPEVIQQARVIQDAGFDTAWATQIFGLDALSTLTAVGSALPDLALGTAVIPVYARHPQVMAQQALSVQSASRCSFSLGIGLSHQVVVEGLWGYSFDRPARYMREYLSALLPLLRGEAASLDGEVLKAVTFGPLGIPSTPAPSVLVAALAPAMIRVAGQVADGTVTWMTGISTIGSHVAPRLNEAAAEAGRPAPRIVVSLPISLTENPSRAAELIDAESAIYPTLPSYKAMLEIEGASSASGIGLLGSREQIVDGIGRLAESGGTELIAAIGGTEEEKRATFEFLGELSRSERS